MSCGGVPAAHAAEFGGRTLAFGLNLWTTIEVQRAFGIVRT